jgi:peptide/nickel transport system ATP-binding protein
MLPSEPVLEVKNLTVEFPSAAGVVKAVNDVSFRVGPGEILGLVGESGSGKSTVAHALLRVLHPSAVLSGEIRFRGTDVLAMGPAQLRKYCWESVSLVTQGAMNSLNPVMTIQNQIADVIRAHRGGSWKEAKAAVPELLELVGIDPARQRAYPHELSGGMRQRCVIAMALSLQPDLIVMDEPTTALDVVVQRGIMDELGRLREQMGFSVLLISHDLDLVAERASRVAVMYAGELVEVAPARDLVFSPLHPYTTGLLASAMSVDGPASRLDALPGKVPDLIGDRTGCMFFTRCANRRPWHEFVVPRLLEVTPGRQVACHLYSQGSSDD